MHEINLLTADPVLRLLLALTGYEASEFPFGAAWTVFSAYLRIPAPNLGDVSSFQVETTEENALFVRFVRELRDGIFGKAVLLEFSWPYDPPLAPETEIWSDDFEGVDDFLNAVAQDPTFRRVESGELSGFFSTLYGIELFDES